MYPFFWGFYIKMIYDIYLPFRSRITGHVVVFVLYILHQCDIAVMFEYAIFFFNVKAMCWLKMVGNHYYWIDRLHMIKFFLKYCYLPSSVMIPEWCMDFSLSWLLISNSDLCLEVKVDFIRNEWCRCRVVKLRSRS